MSASQIVEMQPGDLFHPAMTPAFFGMSAYHLMPAAHHWKWLETILTSDRTLIVAPRESAKTTWIAEILMAWWIGRYPLSTNAIVSVNQTLASERFKAVRQLIENNRTWEAAFPTIVPDYSRGWNNRALYVRDNSVEYQDWISNVAHRGHLKVPNLFYGSTGGANVIGKRISGLAVIDDPHNENVVRSPVVRDAAYDWLNRSFLPAITQEGKVVIITTRWHRDDFAGRIIAEEEERRAAGGRLWEILEIPAIDAEGESYWPEVWPVERLNIKRDEIGSVYFRCMYLNDPDALVGKLFQVESFRHCAAADTPKLVRAGIFVDLAISKKTSADFTVLALCGVDTDNNFYIIRLYRGKWAYDELLSKLTALYVYAKRFYTSPQVGVENVVFQEAIVQRLRHDAPFPIKGVNPKGKDKVTRALDFAAQCEAGMTFADTHGRWFGTFLDEAVDFPDGKHDDQIDAVVYAYENLVRSKSRRLEML